jgi:predicted transposase YbfD/YdcC
MECTLAPAPPAIAAPLPVTPASLLAAFAAVPDPRRQASVTYALPAVLALAVTALLANQDSVLAIAEWAGRQGHAVLGPLGLATGRAPCQSTLQRLFAKLDGRAVAAALTAYFTPRAAPAAAVPQGVAVDGKAQRGRLPYQAGGCPVHALTAFCHAHGVVLAHEPIAPAAAPGEKGAAELSVARALLARLDWRDRVLTGDALLCQRKVCEQVLAAGGDYLLVVKENQPTLHRDIALLFDPPADDPGAPLRDCRAARTVDHGHGRAADTRHLLASTDLAGYSDWPGLAQVFRLERTWRERGRRKGEVRYGITSLPPARADPADLLALKRGHWGIENRAHYVKDVTFGEDRSPIHTGAGPTIAALLRDAALGLLRLAGQQAIASRRRHYHDRPREAVALVVGPPPSRA